MDPTTIASVFPRWFYDDPEGDNRRRLGLPARPAKPNPCPKCRPPKDDPDEEN